MSAHRDLERLDTGQQASHSSGARRPLSLDRRSIVRTQLRPARLAARLIAAALAVTVASGWALPATASSPGREITTSDVDEWLDEVVPAALERTGIVGAAVAVVHNGEVVTERGFGEARTATSTSPAVDVDPQQTLFRAGSVSKLFTATAVMQLVESGELDLDTDVDDYLDFELPTRFDEPITLRHLLTHTAGFEERVRGLIQNETNATSLRETIVTDPPVQVFAPGTTPAYSNYGNALAGYIVETVSGEPFADYVQEHILDVAGMTSSSFQQPLAADLEKRLAGAYANAEAPAAPFEYVGGSPAGALSAPVSDMSRFMLAQLGDLPEPLLEPETLALMQRPALDASTLGNFASGPRMGIGFFEEDRNGERIVGHGGDTQFHHTHLQLYPDSATGIYIAINSGGRTPIDSLEIREEIMHGFTDRYFAADASPVPPADTAAQHAALAAGTYGSSRAPFTTFFSLLDLSGQVAVSAQPDGTLLLEPGPESDKPAVFEEIAPWVWQDVDGGRIITMRVTDGEVDAIGYGAAFTMLKLPFDRTATGALLTVAVSIVVLLAALIVVVVNVIRHRREPRPRTLAARLTTAGAGAAIIATVSWAALFFALVGFADVPDALIRIVQVVQALAFAALVPATIWVVEGFRRRAGWLRITGRVLVLLALGRIASFAIVFNLLSPDISY